MTNDVERLVRCADCKYWNNANTYNVIPSDLKGKYGRCEIDGFNYEGPVGGRTDMLIYSDYESYAAGFDTGADFACIHGTKRT